MHLLYYRRSWKDCVVPDHLQPCRHSSLNVECIDLPESSNYNETLLCLASGTCRYLNSAYNSIYICLHIWQSNFPQTRKAMGKICLEKRGEKDNIRLPSTTTLIIHFKRLYCGFCKFHRHSFTVQDISVPDQRDDNTWQE